MSPPAQPSRAIPRGSSSRAVKSLTETIFLQPVNPLEHPDWDAPLTRRPDFSFFHGAAWPKVLVETYGFPPVGFGGENSLRPLMEVDSWLPGPRGTALPFTDD